MGPTNFRRFSIRVHPEADLNARYTAVLCAKEIINGMPSEREQRRLCGPTELQPILERLALADDQISSILSRFGHEQAITITADVDLAAMQREGFKAV